MSVAVRTAELPTNLCAELRELRPAAVASQRGAATVKDVSCPEMLLKLWSSLQSHVPKVFEGRTLVGPHPTLRFLEYQGSHAQHEPGEMSHPVHADTPLQDSGLHSSITVLVYLNSDFEGGSLRFFEDGSELDVFPKEGMVVIFPHKVLHRAAVVVSGTKWVLKLSVLYTNPKITSEPSSIPTISLRQADMEERLPFIMAARSATNGSILPEAQAGYFARDALWKHTLSMVGTKEDAFRSLVEDAKDAKDGAVEPLLDFILQHDVSSWSQELLALAFLPMTKALTSPLKSLKLKAYKAFDMATPLHNHDLCILLGETLMHDFDSTCLEIRVAALHAWLTLMSAEQCRAKVLSSALTDPEPQLRLTALRDLVALVSKDSQTDALRESYADALRGFVQTFSDSTQSEIEISLAVQALSMIESD
ncbi:Fe2OG dioxygenase domain-containing protein [Durusdinium trenchii]|uniref:Fe2OG dioxygenase domain-containing protein n=1 Tax=Durusdinium trenchii TaxID=1381693 RepID=A0ABP0HJI8_9DINO